MKKQTKKNRRIRGYRYQGTEAAVFDRGFFFPTGHPKPEHSGSGRPDRFHRKPVEIGQIPVQIQIVRRIWESTGLTGIPAGLAGIPVGLTGNRSNSIFFLFWFKFKCP